MTRSRICDCCGERQAAAEALAHGHAYCESCAVDSDPQCECGRPADPHTYDRPLYLWSDHSSVRCSECLKRAEYRRWADAMCARLEAAALAGGWEIEDVSHAETGSIYYTFWRRSHALDDLDEDEIEDGDERIVVRISDHASAYCREDYSLTPDGLEHDADEVLARIAARAWGAHEPATIPPHHSPAAANLVSARSAAIPSTGRPDRALQ